MSSLCEDLSENTEFILLETFQRKDGVGKKEGGGEGRTERGTGIEKGRSIGRKFPHYKSDIEKNTCKAGGGG